MLITIFNNLTKIHAYLLYSNIMKVTAACIVLVYVGHAVEHAQAFGFTQQVKTFSALNVRAAS